MDFLGRFSAVRRRSIVAISTPFSRLARKVISIIWLLSTSIVGVGGGGEGVGVRGGKFTGTHAMFWNATAVIFCFRVVGKLPRKKKGTISTNHDSYWLFLIASVTFDWRVPSALQQLFCNGVGSRWRRFRLVLVGFGTSNPRPSWGHRGGQSAAEAPNQGQ